MNRFLASALLVIPVLFSCNRTDVPQCTTGLTIFNAFDSSRKFDTTGSNKNMFYRPVKIDLFYPSTEKPGSPALSFGDLLDLYGKRMNYDEPIDSIKKGSRFLAGIFAGYLHLSDSSRMLHYSTPIHQDIQLPQKKFPLIIYAASMNGGSWENYLLFDSLAKQGFVVAAISSVGKFPGFMSDPVDLEEQVNDILFAKEFMKKKNFIDTGKIGLLSWSLGGTAIAKAAMLSADISCMASFDGTEIHYYGSDTSWDREYKQIMNIPPYAPERITVPYLYLSSEHPANPDSVYVFPDFISSQKKYFLKFNGGEHENFSSIISVAQGIDAKQAANDNGRHQLVIEIASTFFNEYLKKEPPANTEKLLLQVKTKNPALYSLELPVKDKRKK